MLNSCCALPALGRHNDSWRWLPSDTPWLTRTTSPRSRVPSPRFRASAAVARRSSPRRRLPAARWASPGAISPSSRPWRRGRCDPAGRARRLLHASAARRRPGRPRSRARQEPPPRSAPRSPPRALLRPRRRSWTRVPAFPVRLQRSILGTPDDAPLPYASPTRPPADPPARAHPLPQTATANSASSS